MEHGKMLMFHPGVIRYAVHCTPRSQCRVAEGAQKVREAGFFRLLLREVAVIIAAGQAAGLYISRGNCPERLGAEVGGGFAW